MKMKMKKVLLTLMLTVVSSSAMAEWDQITTDVDGVTYYADPDTIRKSGNLVKMWVMNDYKIADKPGVLSARYKVELDCNKKQYRRLFVSLHSGHMGRGETLFILNERDDWDTLHPDSIAADEIKFACSFRSETPETFPEETFS